MLELLALRERGSRRDTRLQGILQFVHTNVWRALFGRVRDTPRRGVQRRGCPARCGCLRGVACQRDAQSARGLRSAAR